MLPYVARFVGLSLLLGISPAAQAIYSDSQAICQSAVAISTPNDTNEDIVATCPLPARAMGNNATVRVSAIWTVTNNANVKTARVRFSGIAGTIYASPPLANQAGAIIVVNIQNRGVPNSQVGYSVTQNGFSGILASSGAVTTSSVDTTAPSSIVITCQKATGTDTCTLESYLVELIGGGT